MLHLLNEPPRKTTRISCDPQPWTLHADRLTTANGEQKCQTLVSRTPPVTVIPVSPRRGRCETLEGKRPMETFEVPGEMCALLSQAVGPRAAPEVLMNTERLGPERPKEASGPVVKAFPELDSQRTF